MICIVDYGLGNIKAFANLYSKLNIDFIFAKKSSDLCNASKIILPGVGAFDHAMKTLNKSGMRESLDELVLENGIPVIGVCVGMQMMANKSEEGRLSGLGWIPGEVKKFKRSAEILESNFPLPHMGWNSLSIIKESKIFERLDDRKKFYFLHSYYYQPYDDNDTLATADYGHKYSCVINRGNIYGVQCHPEKSHNNGIALLKSFASL